MKPPDGKAAMITEEPPGLLTLPPFGRALAGWQSFGPGNDGCRELAQHPSVGLPGAFQYMKRMVGGIDEVERRPRDAPPVLYRRCRVDVAESPRTPARERQGSSPSPPPAKSSARPSICRRQAKERHSIISARFLPPPRRLRSEPADGRVLRAAAPCTETDSEALRWQLNSTHRKVAAGTDGACPRRPHVPAPAKTRYSLAWPAARKLRRTRGPGSATV
jgi:hypothetical protein